MAVRPATPEPLNLLHYNCWTALTFLPKELFAGHDYATTDLKRGFGYEDWHFNCETLASGIQHRPVPGTAHFIRRKPGGSQSQSTIRTRGLMPPSRLFDDRVLAALCETSEAGDRDQHAGGNLLAAWRRFPAKLSQLLSPGWWHANCPGVLRPLLKQLFLAALRAKHTLRSPVPDWLRAQWQSIHAIEPELFPCRRELAAIRPAVIPRSRVAPHYPALSAAYGSAATHVLLLPALTSDDAGRAALQHIQAIVEAAPHHRLTCIATENQPSRWSDRLPKQARLVELGRQLAGCSEEEQEFLLVRLLLQKRPAVVHCIRSALGYRMLVSSAAALASQSKLFVSIGADEVEATGRRISVAADALWRCFDHLTAVFTATVASRQRLIDVYALESAKLKLVDELGSAPGYLIAGGKMADAADTSPARGCDARAHTRAA